MGYQALLFCPDEKTARTVTHVLSDLDFAVEPCKEPFAAVKRLMAQHFDAVVVDCDNEQNATLLFKSARNSSANQTSLAVAVVEGQAGVAKAFRIGANLVLTRPINVEQAKGTLRVARGLLRKGAEAPKGTPTATGPPAPMTPAVIQTARPSAPPAPTRPAASPNTAAPSFSAPAPKPRIPAPPVRPVAPQAPPMRASAPTFEADTQDFDSILEADDAEVLETPPAPAAKAAPPAPPAPETSPAASGTPRSFPWQPAKPMAEPMGWALRRAAEVAGKVESARPAGTFEALLEEKRPSSIGMHLSRGTAAAPAPERLQPTAVAPPAELPSAPHPVSTPTFAEPAPPKVVETQACSYSDHDVAPPTFFPGAYDPDEEEGGGKAKAIVILAAVVLLASSAGYLSWKDTHSKNATAAASAPAPTAPAATTPETTAPVTDRTKTQETSAPAPEVSEITSGGDSGTTTAPAAKPAASKPVVKEAPPPADADPEPEVTQRIIVKNDTRRGAPPPPDEPAPTDVDMGAAPDTKALASISNTPARVPKAAPQVVKVSQGVMEGLVIKRVQPKYPTQAMQLRIQGAVQLQATVSKNGSITNLKVISGDGLLARAAQDAVKQWQYKPYYLNGEPVEIQTQILVNFKLPN